MSKYIKTKNVKETMKSLGKQTSQEFVNHLNTYIEHKLRVVAETSYNRKRIDPAVWNLILPLGR